MPQPNFLEPNDTFVPRHIGPTDSDIQEMLATLSLPSLEALVEVTVPSDIRLQTSLTVPSPRGEQQVLAELRGLAGQNQVWRSLIGMGYYDCVTPLVIQRNILEDPGWYTQYTPYQAEIAQGRLEALVNFQTMVADLTGLPLANASLLDEATAAAEAMTMCAAMSRAAGHERKKFFVSENCHPQTIAVVQTRAEPLGIVLQIGAIQSLDLSRDEFFGLLLQYPSTDGYVGDYSEFITRAHASGAYVVVATDLLALTLLRSPGEFGADVAVGSSQRFGVPLGFGGPHAAFLATKEEFRRQMPGRIIGVSKDVTGRVAYRLSLQTREQHIRREKATSNICTAQVLLAVMAGMYAVYHGPAGLRRIAERIHGLTMVLAEGLRRHGCAVGLEPVFDTLRVPLSPAQSDTILNRARQQKINLRQYDDQSLGLSLDEWSTVEEVQQVLALFVGHEIPAEEFQAILASVDVRYPAPLARTSPYLTHPVFHRYHAEHELLRYIHRLQSRDLSLVHSMIPLG
ncbi:MAG TPA: glycine dehydrogenase (aminomethyl-transferring), partial [Nitrospira sp.]|nr:glycine dehydrogenase (aminomethyl-transferring) [Nitrospira sp.]